MRIGDRKSGGSSRTANRCRRIARMSTISPARTGIAYPVRFTAGADQVPLPANLDRVHRQRDYFAGLPPANFENKKVAADEADPNQRNKGPPKQPLDPTRLEKFWGIAVHHSGPEFRTKRSVT